MRHARIALHHPTPRRSYRRLLLAGSVALAMALSLPAVGEAQQCLEAADCSCTPTTSETTYPMGDVDGLGFATPQAECEFVKLLGLIEFDETVRAIGYLDVDVHHNGCVRGRRSLGQKSLAQGWRAWGAPDDVSVSGKSGAHMIMAWTKRDPDGKTFAVIKVYASGFYRTSGLDLRLGREIDHLTLCRLDDRLPIVVPTQNGQPDGPSCCGTPYPKTPGRRCTYRPDVLPGRQCRAPAGIS